MLGPAVPKIVGFSQGFPLLMLSHDFSSSDAKFPTCAYKHTTMVPAESVTFCRYSDPKPFLSAKPFLTSSKKVRQNLFM